MKYLIMCGGIYKLWSTPKHLVKIKGEPIVARTIRLLKQAGVDEKDIGISTNRPELFQDFGVNLYIHDNSYKQLKDKTVGDWVDAFYPLKEPVCYIFGDVVFSPEAIQEIVDTEVEDIMFFASAPPFADNYIRDCAEPFAYKVVDIEQFFTCIERTRQFDRWGCFGRQPVSWELWQIIKGTQLNVVDYTNYHVINDYSCDIDYPEDVELFERIKEL